MRPAKVLILYNEPVLPESHPDAASEHEILWTADAVSKALVQGGYEVSRLGASRDPSVLVNGICRERPDVVFNLFEGTADDASNESSVASILEWIGIPFTGSPAHTLCLARNKHLTKHLFRGAGLPTADFFVVDKLPLAPCALEWPVIVKPALQDASVGLDQGSVVTDQEKLEERVAYLLNNYGPPVLIEQFIRGREFTAALIEAPELKPLPVSEILFVDKDPGYWPIVTYDAKWKPGTRDYEATPPRYPADITPKLAERIQGLAMEAFRLVGCRDYARVDFRVRASGKAYLLEVNPNPCFGPTAGLAGGLISAGLTHSEFTVKLVQAALARGGKAQPVVARDAKKLKLRTIQPGDLDALRKVGESCAVFRPDELSAALERVIAALDKTTAKTHYALVAERGGNVVGGVCFGPVACTDAALQLHWIVAMPESQRRGVGWQLLQAVEAHVKTANVKVLLAETSSMPAAAQARQFFLRQGFRLVGDVPDFYREGEARMTYAKYFETTDPAAG